MGIRFPDDYREFALRYGSGGLRYPEIRIYSPFDADYQSVLDHELQVAVATYMRTSGQPKSLQAPVFPEKNGNLTWGSDSNAYYFYWATKGPPDKWTVGVRNREGYRRKFKMSFTTFLAKFISQKVDIGYGKEEFPEEPKWIPRTAKKSKSR